ncbi:MAG: TniQ family protein [Hydrogenovibrio sp.]|uniref:TniQ family protein n=1 Tax=Hydrogenovibrio sp. TaxID=2065821 RepID=UPI00287075D6|nr:TniQ family protein [Hydrogenovibrio sp.]MDR9498381.1 TniQ family protein [Hydrogenovibrio sp.]
MEENALKLGRYLLLPPFGDELMSSWIARNAMFYGMKPSQLTTLLFDDWNVWKADVDVYLRKEYLDKLPAMTGIPASRMNKLPLHADCEHFYSANEGFKQVKWVMPMGTRSPNAKGFGLQYCPCCLVEDDEWPYFRKKWRLAFFTECPDHGVQLHDRCPDCGTKVSYRMPQKWLNEWIYHHHDMVNCSHCGFDLRETPYTISHHKLREINMWHRNLYTLGWGKAGNQNFLYSNLYFEGLKRLLAFLVCSPKAIKLWNHLCEQLGIPEEQANIQRVRQSEIEHREIEIRRTGLLVAHYLLEDWPNRFIHACKTTGTSRHEFYTPRFEFPFWFGRVLDFELREDEYHHSDEEREAMRSYVERRIGRGVQDHEIARFISKLFVSKS